MAAVEPFSTLAPGMSLKNLVKACEVSHVTFADDVGLKHEEVYGPWLIVYYMGE